MSNQSIFFAASEDRISPSDGSVISPSTPTIPASGSSANNLDHDNTNNSSLSSHNLIHLMNGGGGGDHHGSSNGGPAAGSILGKNSQHHNGDLNGNGVMANGGLNGSLGGGGSLTNISNGNLNNSGGSGGDVDYMERMEDDCNNHHGGGGHDGGGGSGGPPSSSTSGGKSKRGAKNASNKDLATPRDSSKKDRGRGNASSNQAGGGGGAGGGGSGSLTKEEQLNKLEGEIKKLKVDLQLSRNKENDLRDQIVSYMTSERTLKSEISNLQVEKSLLESRVTSLTSTRAAEKAHVSSLERKLTEERKQKADFQIKLETERKSKKEAASAERTAQQNATRSEVAKLEAEIKTLRGELERARDRGEAAERELYNMKIYKESHGDPEVLANALDTLKGKNMQLEAKLSDETKLKMDLFSALGEAKREISIRDGYLKNKAKECSDLKVKIAELLACMPTGNGSATAAASTASTASTSGGGVHVSASSGSLTGAIGGAAGGINLGLDLPAATDLSFNTAGSASGKLTAGLGLTDLEDKLTGGLYTPASLGGTAYTPKANGNMDA